MEKRKKAVKNKYHYSRSDFFTVYEACGKAVTARTGELMCSAGHLESGANLPWQCGGSAVRELYCDVIQHRILSVSEELLTQAFPDFYFSSHCWSGMRDVPASLSVSFSISLCHVPLLSQTEHGVKRRMI